ncbi:unnamed protein product [Diplocarpon coronariae]
MATAKGACPPTSPARNGKLSLAESYREIHGRIVDTYDSNCDVDWDDKRDVLSWRGVNSGGANTVENWKDMHRARLVLLTIAAVVSSRAVGTLSEAPELKGSYQSLDSFQVSEFARRHTDVGFTACISCLPDCNFLGEFIAHKNKTTTSEQFLSKFLVDVDGHSFSGRWFAFLRSKSLGMKSTIFRQWHDSRRFAWRYFAPWDDRTEGGLRRCVDVRILRSIPTGFSWSVLESSMIIVMLLAMGDTGVNWSNSIRNSPSLDFSGGVKGGVGR